MKDRFIKDDFPNPFIASSYLDNVYLDREQYGHQLDKLDELTKLQLKFGDWDAVLKEGLLITRDKLNKALISYNDVYWKW